MPDRDVAERAKELLVYGPIGLALYVKDTAPSFLRLFVARGRNELDHRKREVGDQIDQMRAAGEDAAATHAPAVLRILAEGVQSVRERAEEALGALGTLAEQVRSEQPAGGPVRDELHRDEQHRDGQQRDEWELAGDRSFDPPAPGPSVARDAPAAAPTAPPSAPSAAGGADLAISGYDDLSASQVVDRLEGLPPEQLEAIRDYELHHRARTTILGKIEQLTRDG